MRTLVLLLIYYEASNYNPTLYEYHRQKFEIEETLGDGYGLELRQKEEQEKSEKEEKEIVDFFIYQMVCEPFCL